MWVEPQSLESEVGGVEANEGDNVSYGHYFGECCCGRKVLVDGGVRLCVILAELEEASDRG